MSRSLRLGAAGLVLAAALTGVAVHSGPAAATAPTSGVPAALGPPVTLGSGGLKGTPVTNLVSFDFYAGLLPAGATARWCFNFNKSFVGPVVVQASGSPDVILVVESTDLENRTGYGWTYCTTIRNASTQSAHTHIHARASL